MAAESILTLNYEINSKWPHNTYDVNNKPVNESRSGQMGGQLKYSRQTGLPDKWVQGSDDTCTPHSWISQQIRSITHGAESSLIKLI